MITDSSLARIDTLLEIGRPREAVPLLQHALHHSPDEARLLCRLAFAFLKMGDFAEARRSADAAIHADPFDEWAHRLCGEILLKEGKAVKAVAALEEAVALNPEGTQSLHALVKALVGAKQPGRAEAVAEHLRQIEPNSLFTFDASVLAAMHQLQWDNVEHYCRAELALDPEYHGAMNNLGIALWNLGRQREAVECFQEAVRLMPSDAALRQRLGVARSQLRFRETVAAPPLKIITQVRSVVRRRKGLKGEQEPNDD